MPIFEVDQRHGFFGVVIWANADSEEDFLKKAQEMDSEVDIVINGFNVTLYLYPSEIQVDQVYELP